MYTEVTTKYPILLVHGLFGFDRIGQFEMFHGVRQALEKAGCRTHVPALSGVHDNEIRGEQLIEQIERFLKRTGYLKVNLIGHSQGALTCRYVAAVRPGMVASVTSVSGPNHGSEVADQLRRALTPGNMPEAAARDFAAAGVVPLYGINEALAAAAREGCAEEPATRGGESGSWTCALADAPVLAGRDFVLEVGADGVIALTAFNLGEGEASTLLDDASQRWRPLCDEDFAPYTPRGEAGEFRGCVLTDGPLLVLSRFMPDPEAPLWQVSLAVMPAG